MKTMSIAAAKAHISELVDEAKRGKRTLISRHGKPVAAIVPVAVATPTPSLVRMTPAQAEALLDEAARWGEPSFDMVADLASGRR
jgi:prevent-host-death family protein